MKEFDRCLPYINLTCIGPWNNDCSGSMLEPLTQCHRALADGI